MAQNGTNILNAISTISAVGSEILALIAELERILIEGNPALAIEFGANEDTTEDSYYYSEDEWVTTGWRWTYPATERRKGRGRKRCMGGLSIVVDLRRDNNPSIMLGFPCIIVAWAAGDDNLWAGLIDGEAEEDFWPVQQHSYDLRHGIHFWRLGVDDGDVVASDHPIGNDWFYIVPLLAVNNPKKLKELLIAPVFSLLSGQPAVQSFAHASEVCRFRWVDGRVEAE